jgi:hypothetical protein
MPYCFKQRNVLNQKAVNKLKNFEKLQKRQTAQRSPQENESHHRLQFG